MIYQRWIQPIWWQVPITKWEVLLGGRGTCSPRKFWNLKSLRCHLRCGGNFIYNWFACKKPQKVPENITHYQLYSKIYFYSVFHIMKNNKIIGQVSAINMLPGLTMVRFLTYKPIDALKRAVLIYGRFKKNTGKMLIIRTWCYHSHLSGMPCCK